MCPTPQIRTTIRMLGLLGTVIAASASISAWGFTGHVLDGRLSAARLGSAQARSGGIEPDNVPISGASIQLWAINTTGYGATATLIGATTGDSKGDFTLNYTTSTTPPTGYYYCPSATTQTYITSSGGSGLGGSNAAIKLLAVLGACGSSATTGIGALGWVNINELSTVAATYSLQQFMDSTGANIGTSSTNTSGLSRALGTAALLSPQGVYATAGHDGSFLGTYNNSPAMMNTVADMLAVCDNTSVNSSGPTSGTPCYKLFSDTGTLTDGTGTTLQAALKIAKSPASNVALLYTDMISQNQTLVSSGETCSNNSATNNLLYKPCLTSAPPDWMMAINYSASSGTAAPWGIAIDSSGYVWFTSHLADSSGHYDYINVINPATGSITAEYNLYNATNGNYMLGQLAIDSNGYLVAPNYQATAPANGYIDYFSLSNGTATYINSFSSTSGRMNSATYVATDGAGNAYASGLYTPVSNPGTFSVTNLGTGKGSAGLYFRNCPNGPVYGLAVDKLGYVLVTSTYTASRACGLNSYLADTSGSLPTSESPTASKSTMTYGWVDGVIGYAANDRVYGVAVNSSNDFYVSGDGTNVSEITRLVNPYASGPTYSSSTTANGLGGLNNPAGIAIDSGNNLWVANLGGGTAALSSFSSTLAARSTAAFHGSNSMCQAAREVAIDPSGNVWVSCGSTASINEFVGVAKPVKTPRTGGAPSLP